MSKMVKFKPSMRALSIISEDRKSIRSPLKLTNKEYKKKRTQVNFNVKDFREMEEIKEKLIMRSMKTSTGLEKIQDDDDFKISEEKYLHIIFELFSKKDGRNLTENQLLLNYLKNMSGFVEMLVRGFNDESMVSELLTTISFYLSYTVIERNSVLFRYGEKGDKFYIILKGSVDILIAKERKVRTSEFEYMTYLVTLRKYHETEIYQRCMHINQQTFNVEFEEDIINSKSEEKDKDKEKYKDKDKDKENKILGILGLGANKSSSGAEGPRKSIQARRVSMSAISELSQKILAIPKLEVKKETTDNIKYSLLHPEVFSITSVSSEEYIKRLKVYNEYKEEELFVNFANDPRNSTEASKFKLITVIVYEYHQIASLSTGQTFGELALENPNNKRTATIITKEDTHFGMLNKETYTQCIKEVNERYKKQNLNFIFNNQIFKNTNKHTFLIRHYNYFVHFKFNRGKKLLLENEQINTIYFIKEGEYDVIMNKSLYELTEIIKIWDKDYQKDPLFGKSELNRCNYDLDFKKFYYQKKPMRISIIKGRDIVGFEDFLLEGKSLFTVECTSTKGEAFQLETKFFSNLINSMQLVKENTEEFKKLKKLHLLEKIIKIRDAKVSSLISMLGNGELTENPNEGETNISQIHSMKHMNSNLIGHLGNLKDISLNNCATLINSINPNVISKVPDLFDDKKGIFPRNKKFKLNLSSLKDKRTKQFLEYDYKIEDFENNKEEIEFSQSPYYVKKNLEPKSANISISKEIINKFSPLKFRLSNNSGKQPKKLENIILFNCKTSRNQDVVEKKRKSLEKEENLIKNVRKFSSNKNLENCHNITINEINELKIKSEYMYSSSNKLNMNEEAGDENNLSDESQNLIFKYKDQQNHKKYLDPKSRDENFESEVLEFSKDVYNQLDHILSSRRDSRSHLNHSPLQNRVIKISNLKTPSESPLSKSPLNRSCKHVKHLLLRNTSGLNLNKKINKKEDKLSTSKSWKILKFSKLNRDDIASEEDSKKVIQQSNFNLDPIEMKSRNNTNHFLNVGDGKTKTHKQIQTETNCNNLSKLNLGIPTPLTNSDLIKKLKLNELALETTKFSCDLNNFNSQNLNNEKDRLNFSEKKYLKNISYMTAFKVHNNVFHHSKNSRNLKTLTSNNNFSNLSNNNQLEQVHLPNLKTFNIKSNTQVNEVSDFDYYNLFSQSNIPTSNRTENPKQEVESYSYYKKLSCVNTNYPLTNRDHNNLNTKSSKQLIEMDFNKLNYNEYPIQSSRDEYNINSQRDDKTGELARSLMNNKARYLFDKPKLPISQSSNSISSRKIGFDEEIEKNMQKLETEQKRKENLIKQRVNLKLTKTGHNMFRFVTQQKK